MKVNRQDYQQITSRDSADWLNDYMIDEFLKNAYGPDYLKQYLDKLNRNNFSTIEEKMADIKERIGFDVSNRLREEIETIEKSAAKKDCNCGCGGCSIPPKTAKEEAVQRVQQILDFIDDMVSDRPRITVVEVMDAITGTDTYNAVKNQLDHEKLKSAIQQKIDDSRENVETEPLKYMPDGGDVEEYASDDRNAEYYNHAQVGDIM